MLDKNENVIFEPIEVYVKDGPTYLTPTRFPTKIQPGLILETIKPSSILPDQKNINWIWRTGKEPGAHKRKGQRKIDRELFIVNKIDSPKHLFINALSTAERNKQEKIKKT